MARSCPELSDGQVMSGTVRWPGHVWNCQMARSCLEQSDGQVMSGTVRSHLGKSRLFPGDFLA